MAYNVDGGYIQRSNNALFSILAAQRLSPTRKTVLVRLDIRNAFSLNDSSSIYGTLSKGDNLIQIIKLLLYVMIHVKVVVIVDFLT